MIGSHRVGLTSCQIRMFILIMHHTMYSIIEITKKVQERRLKWYGHVMRREAHYVGRGVEMKVQGRTKSGRPKRRWLDKVKDDIREKGLSAD